MPVYEYKGVTSQGKKVSGVQDGESLKGVKTKLKKEGVIVLEIYEGSAARAARRGTFSFGFGSRVKLIDLANATRQLATLLSSGLPLMEALSVLVEQEEDAALKGALSSVRDSVREGASLADALKANPKAFSQLYINMVSAGEASGTLDITLDQLADFLDEQVRFRGRILAALTYPAFMTVIGLGMLFFIFSFVMPRVVGMFEDMKQQLAFYHDHAAYDCAIPFIILVGDPARPGCCNLLYEKVLQYTDRQGKTGCSPAPFACFWRPHPDDCRVPVYAHPGNTAPEWRAHAYGARYCKKCGGKHGSC